MTTYKVVSRRISRYGDHEWIFLHPSGKAYQFAIAGAVYRWSDYNQSYDHVATVVNTGGDGLLRVGSRSAKPFVLGAGEHYLTVDQQPRRGQMLKALPEAA